MIAAAVTNDKSKAIHKSKTMYEVEVTQRREQAKEAFSSHLAMLSSGEMDNYGEVWTEDAVLEFPYAPAGFPAKLVGKAAIISYPNKRGV